MSNLKRFLSLTLAMLMVVGAMATVSAKSFTDVAATDPYAEAVDVLSELGVIAGATTTEFAPDALVERQQMAMFIARLATAQPSWFAVDAAAVFADQTAPVYNAAIAFASTNGFVKGTSATTFDGAASVTLQDAATMLCRVLGYTTPEMDAAYPMSYLMMADDSKLLVGLEDVAPTAALTRGEVAIMLYNAFKAPMATKTIVYGTTGVPTYVVTIPDLDEAKTLMVSKWSVKKIPTSIAATKDFALSSSVTTTSKTLTDPVAIPNVGKISFATIAKFFPEDAVANDYIGIDLNVFTRKDKIISIDVLGEKITTTSASYNADTKTITVDGTAYDLDAYPIDGVYPSETDNCFYAYNGNVIGRVTDPAQVASVSNGFFSIDIINADRDNQKIVFKPYAFSKVTKNPDGKLIVDATNTKVITNNTVGAVENDYVVFFNGGSNKIDVIAVATKAAAAKVTKINNTTNIATLDSGVTVPFTGTPIAGSQLLGVADIAIGASYYLYTVNGVVLKTENAAVTSTTYAPKSYYKVTAVTGDGFDGYRIKVINNAGTASIITVSEINGVAIGSVDATTLTAGANTAKVGDIIVLDGSKIYTAPAATPTVADPYYAAIGDEMIDELTAAAGITATNSNIIKLGTTNVVLVDYSKVVVLNGTTYTAYTGKSFSGITEISTKYFAVLHDNSGIKELAYLYVIGTPTIDETAPDSLYLFVSQGDVTATTVDYNAINLATGAKEVVVFTNAAGTSTIIGATVANASEIYNVKSTNAVPTEYAAASLNKNVFKVLANGYVSTSDNKIYSTNSTKYYVWNTTTNTYDVKAFADIDKTKFNAGIVVFDANNNASYVVIQSQAVFTGVVSVDTTTDNTITLVSTPAADKIYYSLDNGTTYTEYSTGITLTGTVGAVVKVKAYATEAGYTNSAVVELSHTIVA